MSKRFGEKAGKGVTHRQMSMQQRDSANLEADYLDRAMRESADEFINGRKVKLDCSDSEKLDEAWDKFQKFAAAKARKNKKMVPIFTATTHTRALRIFLFALVAAGLVNQVGADIFQKDLEGELLADGAGGDGSGARHKAGNLRGARAKVGESESREGDDGRAAVARRAISAPLVTPPSVPSDFLAGHDAAASARSAARRSEEKEEESGKKRALTNEEIEQINDRSHDLNHRIVLFKRARGAGERIPIAILALQVGFRTFEEEDPYSGGEWNKNVDLSFASFSESGLSNADFSGTTLDDASFTKCSLVGANFGGAGIRATFRQCDLFQANFAVGTSSSQMFNQISVIDSNCNGATFDGIRGEVLVGSTVEGGSDFRGTSWKGADINLRVVNFYGQRLPDDAKHRPDFEGASWDGAKVTLEASGSARPVILARNLCLDGAAEITSVTYPEGTASTAMGTWSPDRTVHSLTGRRVICDDALVSGAVVVAASGNATTGLIGLRGDGALCEGVTHIADTDYYAKDGRGGGGLSVSLSAISQSKLTELADALSKLCEKLGADCKAYNLDALKAKLEDPATNDILEKFNREMGREQTSVEIMNICSGGSSSAPLYIAPTVFPAGSGATSTLVVNGDTKNFLRTFFARIGVRTDRLNQIIDSGEAEGMLREIYGRRDVVPDSPPVAGPTPATDTPSETNNAAVIGGAIGGVVALLIACACCVACCRDRDPRVTSAGAQPAVVPQDHMPAAISVAPHGAAPVVVDRGGVAV